MTETHLQPGQCVAPRPSIPSEPRSLAEELAVAIRDLLGDATLCRLEGTFDPELAFRVLTRHLHDDPQEMLRRLKLEQLLPMVERSKPRRKTPPGRKRGKKALSFVKWAGSKRPVMDQLLSLIPKEYGVYHEPMVGSGTLFFALSPNRAILSDANEELMNCYQVVRDHLPGLMEALRGHENTQEHFLDVRAWDPSTLDDVARAARTIFLNKTCFNGLYRVNSKGLFNVPYGNLHWANICDEEGLTRANRKLAGAVLRQGDFEQVLKEADRGDLVYFDPPYLSPGRVPSIFYAYQPTPFGEAEHVRLRDTFRELASRGCHVILSNSNIRRVHELYQGFTIKVLTTRRSMNCDASRREGWEELVIHNLRPSTK